MCQGSINYYLYLDQHAITSQRKYWKSKFNEEIDDVYLLYPFYSARQISTHLRIKRYLTSRHKIRRLMKVMGIGAIYQKPNTSKKNIAHKICLHLLKDRTIDISNDVWYTNIAQ